ncbi:MAG TPA: NDP-sugar synthase [Chthonomonas sp.]|jgi:NDP-sugar pyrophosphorylase family protein|uniref:NDP-sugar synthase n=1 Tax=Chthonomonas sp. TaxID=2282153 RepID=UPI002B4B3705|nr:NDP-sugar synthase [Chthonomonas sp.]HLH79988.1 NDP-sugar synthase [Chthonomonas sp.]
MRAMILAAGVGSRLDPLTRNVPKPLVPIVNRPVMEYLIELLVRHGFTEIMVNLHYLGDQIAAYFEDGSRWGAHIHWAYEDRLWGDAGSLKRAEDFFKDETFLVIGGDDLTDMDLSRLLKTHREKKALATIALSIVDDPSEYGIVLMNEEGRITRFLEKPKGEVIFSNTANTGVYVFEPAIFELIPHDVFYLFGKQVFPMLLEQKLPLFGHLTAAYWRDVGNLKVYQQTHRDMLEGRVKARIALREVRKFVWMGENVEIDPTAEIGYPVAIGNNVQILAGARVLEHTVIGNNCAVEEGATVQESILWDGAVVMRNTHLERCVVGRNCRVKTNAAIFDGIIVNPQRHENEKS